MINFIFLNFTVNMLTTRGSGILLKKFLRLWFSRASKKETERFTRAEAHHTLVRASPAVLQMCSD